MDKLTEFLNAELDRRGWNYSDLARAADVSRTTVSNVLSGKDPASHKFCVTVALVLDLNPLKVLALAGHVPTLPEPVHNEDEVLRLYRQLDPRERRTVLAMLESMLRESVTDESDPRRGFPSADPDPAELTHVCRIICDLARRGELLTKSEFLEFIRSIDDPRVLRIVREETERKWRARQHERRTEEERATHNDDP